jgi:catalase
MRQQIVKGKVSYEPNSMGSGCPFQAMMKDGGFVSHQERVSGTKIRSRSKSFVDHYSQAKLFYNSQSEFEKRHLQNALIFELSKVTIPDIRERLVGQLAFIDKNLASKVAVKLGVTIKKLKQPNQSIPADTNPAELQSKEREPKTRTSEALSMENTVKDTIKSRIIGFIIANGVEANAVNNLKKKLESKGAQVQFIGPSIAPVKATDGTLFIPQHSLSSVNSVSFDALVLCSGQNSQKELLDPENKHLVLNFVNEAYKHCKAIYFGNGTDEIYNNSNVGYKKHEDPAIIAAKDNKAADLFINAIAQHRVWNLEIERNS